MSDQGEGETFAEALAALKAEYDVSDSEIARRLEKQGLKLSAAAVNHWSLGKRVPRSDAIRALSAAFPKFSELRLFAATGKRPPAPLSPDRREAMLKEMDRLTEEQQKMLLIQARALGDSNEQNV
ncbi:hypothetical protein [Streptomyces acidiscabies]|uniref:XRE family transcriptional regulator n=1 Tax=Streptomyces acidiscabies TaxID=42234 RepID=A0AAP6BKR9_9ACTN|nr:hypothetical protein [Streptomyces acidiscabies]MBZ3909385.1 XRE family transcriptional regulator [Streptomyces acidiscabies]MDX2966614.1 XRE family transcriptional regulator [Streptomyces acidiscabies]MDX3019924.1 XRE family transcriptional regulator [Streptomyces acidiscabies]MDX3796584.1 XRE family transcriptional regulator [Streptomyces acidiscabies]